MIAGLAQNKNGSSPLRAGILRFCLCLKEIKSNSKGSANVLLERPKTLAQMSPSWAERSHTLRGRSLWKEKQNKKVSETRENSNFIKLSLRDSVSSTHLLFDNYCHLYSRCREGTSDEWITVCIQHVLHFQHPFHLCIILLWLQITLYMLYLRAPVYFKPFETIHVGPWNAA